MCSWPLGRHMCSANWWWTHGHVSLYPDHYLNITYCSWLAQLAFGLTFMFCRLGVGPVVTYECLRSTSTSNVVKVLSSAPFTIVARHKSVFSFVSQGCALHPGFSVCQSVTLSVCQSVSLPESRALDQHRALTSFRHRLGMRTQLVSIHRIM